MKTRLNLVLTGNFFIEEEAIKEIVFEQARTICFSRKGSSMAAPVREALAQYYKLPSGSFFIGVGSSQIIDGVLQYFRKMQIVDVIPNFAMAARTCKRMGLDYVQIPVRAREELVPAIRSLPSRENRVIILSSPRNPYGYSFDEKQIQQVLEINKGFVLVDEAYGEYSSVNLLPLLDRFKNLILIRTFSKAWGIGNLRVGYAISNFLPESFQKEYLLPYNIGELSQRVVCALLANPAVVRQSIHAAVQARTRFIARLRQIEGFNVWESDANFVCIEYAKADALIAYLADHNIQISPLHGIRHYPADWPLGLRICVVNQNVEDEIIDHIREFCSQNCSGSSQQAPSADSAKV